MYNHLIFGSAAIVAGFITYVLFMALHLVPTTKEFAALAGVTVPTAVVWLVLTAVIVVLFFGAKRSIR